MGNFFIRQAFFENQIETSIKNDAKTRTLLRGSRPLTNTLREALHRLMFSEWVRLLAWIARVVILIVIALIGIRREEGLAQRRGDAEG